MSATVVSPSERRRSGSKRVRIPKDAAPTPSVDEQGSPTDAVLWVALVCARCQHFLGQRAEALEALASYSAAVDDVADAHFVGQFLVFLGRMQALEGLQDEPPVSLRRAARRARSLAYR